MDKGGAKAERGYPGPTRGDALRRGVLRCTVACCCVSGGENNAACRAQRRAARQRIRYERTSRLSFLSVGFLYRPTLGFPPSVASYRSEKPRRAFCTYIDIANYRRPDRYNKDLFISPYHCCMRVDYSMQFFRLFLPTLRGISCFDCCS